MRSAYADTAANLAKELFSRPLNRAPEPTIVVIFDASGDLTKRKLLPALFHQRAEVAFGLTTFQY